MSLYAIKTFHSDLERLKHFGGTSKETAIRFAFQKLLDEYAKSKDLLLIPEISLKGRSGKTVTPDGTLKDVLRLDHGYWESKDEAPLVQASRLYHHSQKSSIQSWRLPRTSG